MTNPYLPPTHEASLSSGGAVLDAVDIPGVAGQVQLERAGMFSGARLLVAGQPATKKGLTKYLLPGTNTETIEARLKESLRGAEVIVEGKSYPLGPRIPLGLGILVFAPLGLIGVGGALGGAIGAAGMVLNRSIASSKRSVGARAALMLGVFFAAVTLTLVIGGAIRTALTD